MYPLVCLICIIIIQLFIANICYFKNISVEGEKDVEPKSKVEVWSSGKDETGWVGDDTGEGGANKSAAYSSSPVYIN